MMWGYGYENMMGGSFGFIGLIFSLLWLVLLVVIIVAVARWATGKDPREMMHHGVGGKKALDILNERYARGEINKAEFEEKKRDLS